MNIDDTAHLNDHPDTFYRVHLTGKDMAPSAEALAQFGTQFPGEDFFYPTSNRTYRSLSAAQERAALLRFNGRGAVVVKAACDWTVHETKDQELARLRAEVARLRAQLDS